MAADAVNSPFIGEGEELVEDALREYLRIQWPDAELVDVKEFAAIPGGYSRETFRFDAHLKRGEQWQVLPMILRKNPPPAAAILHTSREMEHRLLKRVKEHTSIPVSESYCAINDTSLFGEAAMLIERCMGSGEVSALFNGGPCEDQAESVATRLCELIAQLHLTDPKLLNPDGELDDPRGVGIDPSSWDRYMDTTFEYYINAYNETAFDPLPGWMDGMLWLKRNKPKPAPITLVHGDFNPSNFLYKDGQVTAVIDWENSRMGDPREDLGWLKHMDVLSNTNIFGSVKEDGGFIGHYNKLTGFDVTEEEVEYFRVFTSGNIGVPVLSALKRRVEKEHVEFLHLYIMQPVLGSLIALCGLMNYPLAPEGAA